MNVLLTGFEPFDKDPLNPRGKWPVRAGRLAACCDERCLHRARRAAPYMAFLVMPLPGWMKPWRNAARAGDLPGPGRWAHRDHARERGPSMSTMRAFFDNAGRQPVDTAVQAGGPAAYFSTLPIKAMVRDMRAAGVPAAVSNNGMCNHIFYALMQSGWLRRLETQRGQGAYVVVFYPCAHLARAGCAAPWHAQHGPGHTGAGLADCH